MNKQSKILFVVLALIVFVLLAFLAYKVYEKVKADKTKIGNESSQIQNDENQINDLNEKINQLQQNNLSFSKLMDTMYVKNNETVGNQIVENSLSEQIGETIKNSDGTITGFNETAVTYVDGKLNIEIETTDLELNQPITGIEDDIVSIKMLSEQKGGMPKVIYFLTRTGNVYQLSNEDILKDNFEASKLDNCSQVILLDMVELDNNNKAILAVSYDGTKQILGE